MNEDIKKYLEKYPIEIIDLFNILRQLIFESGINNIKETMWAKLPTYSVNDKFIRLIPFKDHINIEASCIINFKEELVNYKITPKGMLQVFVKQEIPIETLKKVIVETLTK